MRRQSRFALSRATSNASGAVLDDLHFWPGFYFLSVEDAIANYTAFVTDARWDRAWLPVFANGGGDFYAVACHKGRAGWGEVIYFQIDEIEHPVEFHSIQALLATLAAAYESGVFFIDDRGYLEMNDVEFVELANRVDPQAFVLTTAATIFPPGRPWWELRSPPLT